MRPSAITRYAEMRREELHAVAIHWHSTEELWEATPRGRPAALLRLPRHALRALLLLIPPSAPALGRQPEAASAVSPLSGGGQ